jgi:hypothetical protein
VAQEDPVSVRYNGLGQPMVFVHLIQENCGNYKKVEQWYKLVAFGKFVYYHQDTIGRPRSWQSFNKV